MLFLDRFLFIGKVGVIIDGGQFLSRQLIIEHGIRPTDRTFMQHPKDRVISIILIFKSGSSFLHVVSFNRDAVVE